MIGTHTIEKDNNEKPIEFYQSRDINQTVQIESLSLALEKALDLLDQTIEESGRLIEYDEEDPFRRDEWFDDEDKENLKIARQVLSYSRLEVIK